MSAREIWLSVLASTLALLVLVTAISAPLALVLFARYAEVQAMSAPAWSDVTRPDTQRGLVALYVVLALLQAAERLVRGGARWPPRRRGGTMAEPGSRLVPAPPTAEPEGSAKAKGSARNGRQVTKSNTEEESAEEGRSSQEGNEVAAAAR